jgi:hypothetical protein
MNQFNDEARELLRPMLDLFSGADGGVGYAKLHHHFLTDILSKRGENSNIDRMLEAISLVSRLCAEMQK